MTGVFERTDFNNKMALPSDDLARIIEHFHKLGSLDSKHVSTDMLGQAYEWLIAKFAVPRETLRPGLRRAGVRVRGERGVAVRGRARFV